MKNLIGMVDFVVIESEITTVHNVESQFKLIYDYAKFLKQPLELWMFLPCKLVDGAWVVMEEPKWENEETDYEIQILVQEYKQAKERCLFEGFKYNDGYLINGMNCINTKLHQTIEDLVKYNLELTPTAQL